MTRVRPSFNYKVGIHSSPRFFLCEVPCQLYNHYLYYYLLFLFISVISNLILWFNIYCYINLSFASYGIFLFGFIILIYYYCLTTSYFYSMTHSFIPLGRDIRTILYSWPTDLLIIDILYFIIILLTYVAISLIIISGNSY